MKLKFFMLATALVASNFFYQLVTTKEWGVAADRSFFQCVAVLLAFFMTT